MNSIDIEIQEICAGWWAKRLEIIEKQDAFKMALIPKIKHNMDLWVDYDPIGSLLEALHEVGIRCTGNFFSARGILPEKTGMRIWDGIVEVKEGYGAPFSTLTTYEIR